MIPAIKLKKPSYQSLAIKYEDFKILIKYNQCQLEESNLRPSLYEGDALPAELSWQNKKEMPIGPINISSQQLRMSDSNRRHPD